MESVELIEVLEKLGMIEGYIKNIASMNYILLVGLAIISIIYLLYRFLKVFV